MMWLEHNRGYQPLLCRHFHSHLLCLSVACVYLPFAQAPLTVDAIVAAVAEGNGSGDVTRHCKSKHAGISVVLFTGL